MLEINVSCPNVTHGGMSVGTDPMALSRLMERLRPMTDKPMIVKLTPNVTDITAIAKAAVESGADALSMINTLVGMRINIKTGEPIIANRTGGVSGPAVFPVGLACVWRVRTALPDVPIIGIGGIDSGEKALEYLYAGANAVEVGGAALYDPTAPIRVARELDDLLDSRPQLAHKLVKGDTLLLTRRRCPSAVPIPFLTVNLRIRDKSNSGMSRIRRLFPHSFAKGRITDD